MEVNMTSTVVSQPAPRVAWGKSLLKTVGILVLMIPFLAINGFLLEMVQFNASLGAGQTMVIDWDAVPGILLKSALLNAIGLPVAFGVTAPASFGVARALGGKGALGPHSYRIAATYLKIILATTGVGLLTSLVRLAGLLNLVVAAWAAKSMSEAIAEVHGFSNRRGCLTSLAMGLVPIAVIAVTLLLGPLFAQ